jgi:hypothetical protein
MREIARQRRLAVHGDRPDRRAEFGTRRRSDKKRGAERNQNRKPNHPRKLSTGIAPISVEMPLTTACLFVQTAAKRRAGDRKRYWRKCYWIVASNMERERAGKPSSGGSIGARGRHNVARTLAEGVGARRGADGEAPRSFGIRL